MKWSCLNGSQTIQRYRNFRRKDMRKYEIDKGNIPRVMCCVCYNIITILFTWVLNDFEHLPQAWWFARKFICRKLRKIRFNARCMVSLDILFSVFSIDSNWPIASMKSRTYHKRSQTKPHFANYKLKLKPITLQCGVFPLRTMLNVAVDRGNSYRICVLDKIPQSQINCHHVWNWADNWHFLFVVVDKSIKQNVK